MLSEDEKKSRKKFFAATGKTPDQDTDSGLYFITRAVWIGSSIALGLGLFFLIH